MKRTQMWTITEKIWGVLALCFTLLLTACSGLPEGPAPTGGMVVGISTQALTSNDVAKVVLTISGPNISPDIVHNLVKTNQQWKGEIGQIPAGADRTIVAEAFSRKDELLYATTLKGVSVKKDKTTAVVLLLQQTSAPVAFQNSTPIIQAITATSNQVGPSETIQLTAKASDPDGDPLTYEWSSKGGSFGSAKKPETTWRSPKQAGTYTLSLQVKDKLGGVTGTSFVVEVQPHFSTGSTSVNLSFNTFPEIKQVTSSQGSLAPGKTTTLKAEAFDNDGDTLKYEWTDNDGDCKGSFSKATGGQINWTAPAQTPKAGSCTIVVKVSDGRGGGNKGSLTLAITKDVQPTFAPKILTSYQSTTQAKAGDSVVFRVVGQDPQNGKLSVSWRYEKTPVTKGVKTSTSQGRSGGTVYTSQLTWIVPSGPCPHTLSVTLVAASGLSIGTIFPVKCPPTQPDPARRWGRSITTDGAGNRYITGEFEGVVSFGSTTLTSAGKADVFVAKQSSSGAWVWASVGSGKENVQSRGIAVDIQGNVYVIGWYNDAMAWYGSGTKIFKLTPAAKDNVFIAKLDNNGDTLWVQTVNAPSGALGWSIALDSNSNPYITGDFAGTATFGTLTLTSQGQKELYVAKLDTSGNWQWVQQASSGNNMSGRSIAVDSNGNAYLTGYFENSASFRVSSTQLIKLLSKGTADLFVAKIDSSGTWVWGHRAGGTLRDLGASVALGPNENPYLTGYFAGTADFGSNTLTSTSGQTVFVAQLDATGNWNWATDAGGNQSRQGTSLVVDGVGDAYLTGTFQDTAVFGSTTLSSTGPTDMFVAKIDSQGSWLCAVEGTGTDLIAPTSLDLARGGQVVLTGYVRGNASFQTQTLSSTREEVFVWSYTFPNTCVTTTSIGAVGSSGTANDRGTGIAVDSNDNVIVVGMYSGTLTIGTTTLPVPSGHSFFVAKMDSQGNWLWAKQLNATHYNYSSPHVAVDGQNNIYVTARFFQSATLGTTTITAPPQFTGGMMFVAKITPQGSPVWLKGANSTNGNFIPENVSVDPSGNVFVAGMFGGTADFGSTTLTSNGSYDMFVSKWNTAGQFQWARHFGSTGQDKGYEVATDKLGNAYITGSFRGGITLGTTTLSSVNTSTNPFVGKLDSNGQVLWAKSFPFSGSDLRLATDQQNNLYISGRYGISGTAQLGTFTLSKPAGNQGIFVAKLSPSGSVQQVFGSAGGGNITITSITVSSSNTVSLTGSFQFSIQIGSTTLTTPTLFDAYVASVDAQGNWSVVRPTGPNLEMGTDITNNSKDQLILTGAIFGQTTFGSQVITPTGLSDFFVWQP